MLFSSHQLRAKAKGLQRSQFPLCSLTATGIRGLEKSNRAPRGLKQGQLKDFPAHLCSIAYKALRRHLCSSTQALPVLHS